MKNFLGNKALVVLSGGQDSVTCLFWAKSRYDHVEAVTFNYGQKHAIEILSARKAAELAGVAFDVVDVPGVLRSSSPLTDPTAPLEKYENFAQMEETIGSRVELTFVPMRNAFFLTIAANIAVSKGIRVLVTGVCQEDNANYPDCREDFIFAQEEAINLALGIDDFRIETPLMNLSKADTVQLALATPGAYAALAYSHTSYDGQYPPTDNNHSNVLRAHGFEQAGVPDPLVLRAWFEKKMKLPDTSNYTTQLVREYMQLLSDAGVVS